MELFERSLLNYTEEHTQPESELLQELIEVTEQELVYSDMISGRVVGRFLAILVRTSGARRILEIGTFTGYSALMMAEALPKDGELITCEYNQRYEDIAKSFFQRSEHGHKIHLKMGPALETITDLKGPFDLVYLDADKINYPNYYRSAKPLIRKGGLMVIDNVLWSGSVVNPEDDKARAIDELNKLILADRDVENVLLSIRDGVQLVRKV
jgi:caffeoyl-CoA O-methyltransferase